MIGMAIALVAALQANAARDIHAAPCVAGRSTDPAGWSTASPVAAAASDGAAPALPIGASRQASLLPAAQIAYRVAPAKRGSDDSRGGLFAFTVPAGGRYRVALGSGAWIDVVSDGKAVDSVAHGHGPACSGVRKMVDFDLRPGRYLLQIAGSDAASLRLMVSRLS
ncbi:homogentisate 1,2-dioxygenase [Sphingomonas mollis]|nr:homogentisate 1,2-dioxygenase [Sphingomonas sp. BT553]